MLWLQRICYYKTVHDGHLTACNHLQFTSKTKSRYLRQLQIAFQHTCPRSSTLTHSKSFGT